MSVIFTSISALTLAAQKIRNLVTFRSLSLHPFMVYRLKDGVWEKVSSKKLLPSDIVIVERGDRQAKDKQYVRLTDSQFLERELPFFAKALAKVEPTSVDTSRNVGCDMLILAGSCVVDESILTGESVPQIKDSLEGVSLDEQYRDGLWDSKTLFCGTQVLQVSDPEQLPVWLGAREKQPVPGAIGMVLRTGFDTSKGKLIRRVVNDSGDLIKDKDSLWLILILLVIAICSAGYVLYYGLEDESRDKEKLFLRCILIITTVVPP
jgi:cation-transporting ATPase 13A1